MLYRFLAAAIAVPVAALTGTLLSEIATPLINEISASIGADAQLVVWFTAIMSWFVVFAFLSIIIDLLTGAVVESRVA